MIVFFGPAGAGKSTQGKILATKYGWPWLSAGQLIRQTHDVELINIMHEGKLVPFEKVNRLIGEALIHDSNAGNVILDGFPRQLVQAHWLIDSRPIHGRTIDLVVVLDISKSEVMRRLQARGRIDDTPEVISERLRLYHQEINTILDYFAENGVKIVHVDGLGTVDEVHNKVMKELTACKLV
jgi:adenylate kinase